MTTLEKKTALVTGASRGIGRATAQAPCGCGSIRHSFTMAILWLRPTRSQRRSVRGGGRADAVQADLADANGATLLAEKVRALAGNQLDIFVANAGISKAAPIADHTIADFDNLFATNVRGPFLSRQGTDAALQRGIKHRYCLFACGPLCSR